MKEPNRGACIHAVQLCIERALTHLTAAGLLLKTAGMRDEEAGVMVANAYIHARRVVPLLKDLAIVFPREDMNPILGAPAVSPAGAPSKSAAS